MREFTTLKIFKMFVYDFESSLNNLIFPSLILMRVRNSLLFFLGSNDGKLVVCGDGAERDGGVLAEGDSALLN